MRWVAFLSVLFLISPRVSAESNLETQLFAYINSEREREGLEPLQWDNNVYKVARVHSKNMAAMGKISHKGPGGSEPQDRIRNAKIFASKSAENIAGDLNIISAHTSLMKSLYHRDNILDPDFSHGAVAIYQEWDYLYITELFIRRVGDYLLADARRLVLDHINRIRRDRNLFPLSISKSLSNVAQSHVLVQTRLGSMSPLLIMGILSRKMKTALTVNVYTAAALPYVTQELRPSLDIEEREIGIGFTRTQGSLCRGGCYVIALILGSPNKNLGGRASVSTD